MLPAAAAPVAPAADVPLALAIATDRDAPTAETVDAPVAEATDSTAAAPTAEAMAVPLDDATAFVTAAPTAAAADAPLDDATASASVRPTADALDVPTAKAAAAVEALAPPPTHGASSEKNPDSAVPAPVAPAVEVPDDAPTALVCAAPIEPEVDVPSDDPAAAKLALLVADAAEEPDDAPAEFVFAAPTALAVAALVADPAPCAMIAKSGVASSYALPTRKLTSCVLLEPAVVISIAHWTNRYSFVSVRVVPGDHVHVSVVSADVDRFAVVVFDVCVAAVSSVADAPFALVDFQTRTRTRKRPAYAAVTERTPKENTQSAEANVPLRVFSDRQQSPTVCEGAFAGCAVVPHDESVRETSLPPCCKQNWPEAFESATHPVPVVAVVGAVPPSCRERCSVAPVGTASLK
jgi:hypothetical protein